MAKTTTAETHDPDALAADAEQAAEQARTARARAEQARTAVEQARQDAADDYWRGKFAEHGHTLTEQFNAAWKEFEDAVRSGDGAAILSQWTVYTAQRARIAARHSVLRSQAQRMGQRAVRPEIPGIGDTARKEFNAAFAEICAKLAKEAGDAERRKLNDGADKAAKAADTAQRTTGTAPAPEHEMEPVAWFIAERYPEMQLPAHGVKFSDGVAEVYHADQAEKMRTHSQREGATFAEATREEALAHRAEFERVRAERDAEERAAAEARKKNTPKDVTRTVGPVEPGVSDVAKLAS